MQEKESSAPRRWVPESGKSATERRDVGDVKVHVTPKGGRYVDPDDLFESPFLKKILDLDIRDAQAAANLPEHALGKQQ